MCNREGGRESFAWVAGVVLAHLKHHKKSPFCPHRIPENALKKNFDKVHFWQNFFLSKPKVNSMAERI